MKECLDIELESEDFKKLHSKIIRYDYINIIAHSIEDTKNFSEQDIKINVFEELNEIEEDIL